MERKGDFKLIWSTICRCGDGMVRVANAVDRSLFSLFLLKVYLIVDLW